MTHQSRYEQYQAARDAAWRTLLKFRVTELPVDVFRIAQEIGIVVHPWPLSKDDPALNVLRRLPGSPACRSLMIGHQWHVYFLKSLDDSHRHFALAHELGHMILRHGRVLIRPGMRAFKSNENAGDLIEDVQDDSDYAADIFAIRLIAPACVLHDLHMDQPAQIMSLCRLPRQAALLRSERMALLNARNVFRRHPLEKQVYRQFLPFVRSYGLAAHTLPLPTQAEFPALSLPVHAAKPLPPVQPPRAVTEESPMDHSWGGRLRPWLIAALVLAAIVLFFVRYIG